MKSPTHTLFMHKYLLVFVSLVSARRNFEGPCLPKDKEEQISTIDDAPQNPRITWNKGGSKFYEWPNTHEREIL